MKVRRLPTWYDKMSLPQHLKDLVEAAVARLTPEAARRIASKEPSEIPILFQGELAEPETMDALQREIHRLCRERALTEAA
jgi:hypothetical protein